MNELWAIFVPGADEFHAAPSREAAEMMAARHTAAMENYVARNNLKWAHEDIKAHVVAWSFGPEAHAEEMQDFDYAGWGLQGGAA